MYDLFQFPQVLSQFIHKFILGGQSQFSEHLSAHSFTVAKRVCVEVKKKLAPIDCQKSLQYCKKKQQSLIAFTDDKCGWAWQTREGRGYVFAVENSLILLTLSRSMSSKIIFPDYVDTFRMPTFFLHFRFNCHDLYSSVLSVLFSIYVKKEGPYFFKLPSSTFTLLYEN